MKKRLAQNINQKSNEFNVEFQITSAKLSDTCKKLMNNDKLTVMNIIELGQRIARAQKYVTHQLIICNENELSEQLDLHKNDNLDEQPIFIICQNNSSCVTFCFVKQLGRIICLIYELSSAPILETTIRSVVKKCFGEDVEIKIHFNEENVENEKGGDIFCLKALETMMVNLKPNKRDNFIANFENPEETSWGWLKHKSRDVTGYLFSFVQEGYYHAIAKDIDKLARDIPFKNAIKEFINNIPLPEDVQHFKLYQTLIDEYAKTEEINKLTSLEPQLEEAREKAFRKVCTLRQTQINDNENDDQRKDILKKFPIQIKKFTSIFKPLIFMKVDETLHQIIDEISSKLDLDYERVKIFFEFNQEAKPDSNDVTTNSKTIDEVINLLPHYNIQNSDKISTNKTMEQLLSETIVDQSKTLNIDSLRKDYNKIKNLYKLWNSKRASEIGQWARSKKGNLKDSDVHEAIAVLDRANDLITAGHKLLDTQILSVLTFLQDKNKGQLTEVQTGEGKTTIVSILAAIKALKGEKVDIITSNPILAADAVRDKQLFYDLLNLSVSTNNPDENYASGPRSCYKADIVYGSLIDFQADYLRDSFLDLSTRARRPFQSIILDEVDSMIIDNAHCIAKLSGPLPGMESLKYVYLKIWQELHKAEEKIVREFGKKFEITIEDIKKSSLPIHEAQRLSFYQKSIKRIKRSIKLANPTEIDIIPSHIKKYADNSLDRWIDNALYAKFVYHENKHYVIRTAGNEKVIQPVDYKNTGMILKNTIWQYGLHQFLQLKHNLHLTSESLTSCFISNLGYIHKYGNQIFGLTGTLGSEAEQKLLSSIYNVGFAKIPTFKEKKFVEDRCEIVNDEIFSLNVAMIVASQIANGRAVLVICKTIKDAMDIQEVLKESATIQIKMFLDEENARVTEQKIDCGEVVIATNIAGRGTDFRTSAELENNNGLDVCVAFLPCNKRVEGQALGRTARQGNHGTGRLVIKRSEVDKLGVDSNCVEDIKNARDQREKERIVLTQTIHIPKLKFEDELFELFSTLYMELKKTFRNKREFQFVLYDLKEFWAFWLNEQIYEGSTITEKNVKDEFRKFKLEADKIIKGEIQFNPYFSIQQAEYFILSNDLIKAEQSLNHAISISANPEILHSVYLKFFEIAIRKGRVFMDKLRQALGDVLLISKIEPDREYKQTAKKYLEHAKTALQKELDLIEKLFEDEDFPKILNGENNNATPLSKLHKGNFFIKHLVSRQQALNFRVYHADSLIRQIDESTDGLSLGCRTSNYLRELKPQNDLEKKMKEAIMNSELDELARVGTDVICALKTVHDICPEIVKAAQIQIVGGTTVIGTGLVFPPAFPVTSFIGGLMICEGLSDIVVELINMNSDGKFHKKSYIKRKILSVALAFVLAVGIDRALQSTTLLEKAVNNCRWISESLRKCPVLTETCERLANNFDKIAARLIKRIEMINQLNKANQLNNINKLQKCEFAFK